MLAFATPERPDVLPEDEIPSDVSDEDPEVRLKKNRSRVARKQRAEHRKESMRRYNAAYKD